MNWYYVSNGSEVGPVSAAKLRELAIVGGLGPDDLVRSDGMAQLVPARQIKGLISPLPRISIDKDSGTQSSQDGSSSPSVNRGVIGNAAKLNALQLQELRKADLAIGAKAFRLGLGSDVLQSQYEEVRRLDAEIAHLKRSISIDEHTASIEQTKTSASSATTRIGIENLLNKGNRALAQIGREIRQGLLAEDMPELAEEIKAARQVAAQIEEFQRAARSQHKANRPVSRVALTIGACVLVVAIVGLIASRRPASHVNPNSHEPVSNNLVAITQLDPSTKAVSEGSERHRQQQTPKKLTKNPGQPESLAQPQRSLDDENSLDDLRRSPSSTKLDHKVESSHEKAPQNLTGEDLQKAIDFHKAKVKAAEGDIYGHFLRIIELKYGRSIASEFKSIPEDKFNAKIFFHLTNGSPRDPIISSRGHSLEKDVNRYLNANYCGSNYDFSWDLEHHLKRLRANYWDPQLTSKERNALAIEYEKALVSRDSFYINTNDLALEMMTNRFNSTDGGISPFLRNTAGNFDFRGGIRWYIKRYSDNGITELSDRDLVSLYINSLKYARRRDRSEFLFMNPFSPLKSSDPKEFLIGLALAADRVESESKALALVRAITKLAGKEVVARIAAELKEEFVTPGKTLYKWNGSRNVYPWRTVDYKVAHSTELAFAVWSSQQLKSPEWTADLNRFNTLSEEQRAEALQRAAMELTTWRQEIEESHAEAKRMKNPRYSAKVLAEERSDLKKKMDALWERCRRSRHRNDLKHYRKATTHYKAMFRAWEKFVEKGDQESRIRAVDQKKRLMEEFNAFRRNYRHNDLRQMKTYLEIDCKYINLED